MAKSDIEKNRERETIRVIMLKDFICFVFKGKKMFEVDGEEIILEAGQTILIKKGTRVRYSNPFNEPCEYWSCCVPAFSIDTVNREE